MLILELTLKGRFFEDLVFFLKRSYKLLPENVKSIFVQRVLSEKMEKVAGSFSGSTVLPAQPKNLKLIGLHFLMCSMRS